MQKTKKTTTILQFIATKKGVEKEFLTVSLFHTHQ